MADIAGWIVEAATMLGRDALLVSDRLPEPDGSVNLVVAPHEFYTLTDRSGSGTVAGDELSIAAAARCSIPICTEQPGTAWFAISAGLCAASPLVVDINDAGVSALRAEGVDAHRLRLGAVPSMLGRRPGAASPRDVDVVFLGGLTEWRARGLAGLAPVLWDRHCELRTFSIARPITGAEPGVVVGDDKYALLHRSKVMVNIHRGDVNGEGNDGGYFEWARMVEAMANGCVVVSEPSLGADPLVAGEHFVEAGVADLAEVVPTLLDDDARRAGIAAGAYDVVTGELAFERSVAGLLALADPVTTYRPSRPPSTPTARRRGRSSVGRVLDTVRTSSAPSSAVGPAAGGAAPLLAVFAPYRSMRRRLYDELLAETAHRRELGRLRALIEHGDADHVGRQSTPAWDRVTRTRNDGSDRADRADGHDGPGKRVSVMVTMYDYADVVTDTLDSIAASHDVGVEIVVVDDHSHDDGVAVVRDWMHRHPDVATLLLTSGANRGLTGARNLALRHVRNDLVMVMDADNLVYPTCLRRLADALERRPDAAFAYSTLEAFGEHPGLRSAYGWHVRWLCDANYIDAQAMVRTSTFERLGGYRDDAAMYGWEDWDLWLRIAVDGGFGVHVPEMLGRYRTHPGSMHSITNLAADDLRAGLVARYPTLPWPELAPRREQAS